MGIEDLDLEDILTRKIDRIDRAYLSGQITDDEYRLRIAKAHNNVEAMAEQRRNAASDFMRELER